MALKPSLSFLRLGSPASPHILEVWIDYLCPFSAKIVKSLDENVIPCRSLDCAMYDQTTSSLFDKVISEGGKYNAKLQVILRLQPQPWSVFLSSS